MRSIHALGAIALVVALAACTAAPPEPTPTPTTTATGVKPTPKPTPSISVAPLVIPDCETLLQLEVAKAVFGADTVFLGETPASEYVTVTPVPAVPVVLSTASPSRVCRWGIPNSDGVFSLVVAGITDAEGETIRADLTTAGFSEDTTSAVDVYKSDAGATYLFSQDALVFSEAPMLDLSVSVSGEGLVALRTANPTLGL